MKSTTKTVTVTFHPQAWVRDYAIDVDPQGPIQFEVPASAVEGIEPTSYEADALRELDGVPSWIKDWSGPFEMTWTA